MKMIIILIVTTFFICACNGARVLFTEHNSAQSELPLSSQQRSAHIPDGVDDQNLTAIEVDRLEGVFVLQTPISDLISIASAY
ncbi:hypothetical protein [Vibrio sp. WXL210]|uniref:hypothetical protein n=1 Tax=Vibrio sp. WXL210 TaxID=3450709 RepID=UPI003EC7EEC9